jgi:molybdate transport system substrate-binding protein
LPDAVQIITTFTVGLATTSTQAEAARELMSYLASPATLAAKQSHGMNAA